MKVLQSLLHVRCLYFPAFQVQSPAQFAKKKKEKYKCDASAKHSENTLVLVVM